MRKELEPKVIELIASLYVLEPYDNEELSGLLKEYKMKERFTATVFDELKKRQENKVNRD
jgi:hypothetical protein